MQISEWLIQSMIQLKKAGVDAPRTDCLVLLCDALGKEKSWIHGHPEQRLSKKQLETLNSWLARREKREPLAYIRDRLEFYGREFMVNEHVLIPRPESESFITLLKELEPTAIIDIGTGSGCLAITAKLELPKLKVIATDVDVNALAVAKKNAHAYNADIQFLSGSLLEPLTTHDSRLTTLVANLPYVPQGLVTSPEITKEPELALFSGKDGLDHYRHFWSQVTDLIHRPAYILTESLESQHRVVQKLARNAGYKLTDTDGLVQLFTN